MLQELAPASRAPSAPDYTTITYTSFIPAHSISEVTKDWLHAIQCKLRKSCARVSKDAGAKTLFT